ATVKANTVNGEHQLQALIDKKKVIITESSIRSDLHLEDARGADCLPTATIFKELAQMGYEKPSQKLSFLRNGIFINQQLGDMSQHKKIYVNPSHTKKIFANMKREGIEEKKAPGLERAWNTGLAAKCVRLALEQSRRN
ncbi:hypothetical protein Tco_0100121, partial [Tanacetum coccineum]